MTSWKNGLTTAALAAGVAVVLVGCSSSGDAAPSAEPSVVTTDAAVAATPAEEPAPVPPAIGETITAEQAEALPEGQRAYTMADGSLVVIDDAAPLPEAVRAEMLAPALAAAKVADGGFARTQAGSTAETATFKEITDTISAASAYGRSFYVIVPIDGDAGRFWTAIKADRTSLFDAIASKDEAIASAQATAEARNAAGMAFTEVVVP